jgi:NAD(P) transhydrogenase subunit beta
VQETIINISYLVASILFILGMKGLTHPRTAVRGNRLGALAMLIAVVVTLFDQQIVDFQMIILGLIIGTIIGATLAIKVEMTSMPELVAAFNGFGGAASALVAGAALVDGINRGAESLSHQFTISVVVSGLIGALTFTGSFIAFGKLKGLISGNAIKFGGQNLFNALIWIGTLGLCIYIVMEPAQLNAYWALLGIAGLLGILLTIPIGGADMPVVIALLNSYSGLAASATGFVLNNNVLIIAGSLVGASGLILTQIMCKAMNRSLFSVIFGSLEAEASGSADGEEDIYTGRVTSSSADEIAMLFDTASRVSVVPGYGLAVSQGQHAVRDLANLLEERGINVDFAIHPVAGRMPGHMNVLLAEADVPYEKLIEMDQANSEFEQTDVVLVIGANDVVNPLARTDPKCPIAGMPILDVDKARTVVVIKRSLSHGYAGIPNPLFAADNTLMLFGDGKKAILELIAAIKEQ